MSDKSSRTSIKMEGLQSQKQMFLLFDSQHFSAQIGHHQVFLEEIYKCSQTTYEQQC
jgi:hypothetical protein